MSGRTSKGRVWNTAGNARWHTALEGLLRSSQAFSTAGPVLGIQRPRAGAALGRGRVRLVQTSPESSQEGLQWAGARQAHSQGSGPLLSTRQAGYECSFPALLSLVQRISTVHPGGSNGPENLELAEVQAGSEVRVEP